MTLAASVNSGQTIKQSTAYNRVFFMGTGNTGLSLTATLSKDAGAHR